MQKVLITVIWVIVPMNDDLLLMDSIQHKKFMLLRKLQMQLVQRDDQVETWSSAETRAQQWPWWELKDFRTRSSVVYVLLFSTMSTDEDLCLMNSYYHATPIFLF